jgi:hypothetical protein
MADTNQLIYGFGRPDFLSRATSALAAQMIYVEPFGIEISGNSSKVQSKKQVEGKTVIAGSIIKSEETSAKITIEATSWMAMQLAYGELAQTSTNVEVPDIRKAKAVLNGAAGEIVDLDIATTGSFTTPIWVFDIQNDRPLTRITTGTPSVNQFLVDAVNHKIVLSPLRVGQKLAYRIVQQVPSIQSLGYEDLFTPLNQFGFTALAKGDAGDLKLVVPLMSRTSAASINLTDVTKLEITYDCLVAPGYRTAYQLLNPNAA